MPDLEWGAAQVVAAEIGAAGELKEASIVGHNVSPYASLPRARPTGRFGGSRKALHEATQAAPLLLPLELPPVPPDLVLLPHHHLHESIASRELERAIGPRHLHVGPAAALDGKEHGRRALVRRADGERRFVKDHDADSDLSLMGMADGVGTLTYDKAVTANERLNRELRRRLVAQDIATIVMLVLAFVLTVLVSCLNVYHFSADPSPVVFYSDPKLYQQRLLCSSAEADAFLQAFNVQPSTARLRIVGRSREDQNVGAPVRDTQPRNAGRTFRGRFLRRFSGNRRPAMGAAEDRAEDHLIFDVALDLTPFITGAGRLSTEADSAVLERHLCAENPLEVLVLCKRVEWAGWEDVATNIRQHLRSLGFQGDLEVRLEAHEEMLIYRNHPWQNFVRNRVTQCLVVLSVVGALFWVPYLWARSKTVRVESKFEVHLDIERYWELLVEGLHAQEGFQGAGLVR